MLVSSFKAFVSQQGARYAVRARLSFRRHHCCAMVASARLATARGSVKPPRDRHWLHKTSLSNLSVCGLVSAAVLLVTM